MPELPEVEQVRRELAPYLEGARVRDVELRRANLRTPFPPEFRERLIGQTVRAIERRAKYLLAGLSSGETLVMHLGMTGEFRVDVARAEADPALDRPDAVDRHDHVIFTLDSGTRVTFNDARRFGFMDLVAAGALDAHPTIGALGPEPLSPAFDAAALARALRGKRTPIKVALLDQRVVAGLGNIYASEALHVARVSPFRMIVDSGIHAGMSSDGMQIAPMNPFIHAYYATTGRNALGVLTNDGQQISRRELLDLYTRRNAWFLGEPDEDQLGTLEVGRLGDVAVLDRDYFSVPDDRLRQTSSVLIVVGGAIVHSTGKVD